ncbi:TPA: hypothetical protein HA244_01350 [Candidatus Micrarchaeota archaeon]|nr:hypothetical protein [Candidatus Micrarchaeota archaeon]
MDSFRLVDFLLAQKQILSRKRYLAFFLFATVFFAGVFVFLTTSVGTGLDGWLFNVPDYAKLFVAIASPLFALILTTQLFILFNYRFSLHEFKAGGGAVGAFLSGLLATACCSPVTGGILYLLGLSGLSFFLQSHSLEVLIAATVILLFSLYYSSKIIFCEECRVKVGKGSSH